MSPEPETIVPAADARPAASLGLKLDAARLELTRAARAAAELDKAVAALGRAYGRLEAAPRPVLEALEKVRALLAKSSPAPDLTALLSEVEGEAKASVERAAHRFGTSLAAALRAKLGETQELKPLDAGFAWGALRILPEGDRFRIEYARQGVLKNLASDPEVVASAAAKVLSELEGPGFDADAYLGHLYRAYSQSISRAGKQPGEMVDILEFWSFLTWELQPDAFRREPTSRRFRDYPLFRFAHDLARLRAARKFEVGGKRLELQTAVHDRAYGKSLWVPEDKTGGTYFQAIALR